MGTVLYWPCYLAWLAALAEAPTLVDTADDRWGESELCRLQGELRLKAGFGVCHADFTPEACSQKALDIARFQHAKSLELRAATSLAHLWQQQEGIHLKREKRRDKPVRCRE